MYRFGDFGLDPGQRLLTRNGVPVPLAPKYGDLLIQLLRSEGRLVTRTQILEALRPGLTVEEGNVAFQISALRKALGEQGAVWYQLSAPVAAENGSIRPAETAASVGRRAASSAAVLVICVAALWITSSIPLGWGNT